MKPWRFGSTLALIVVAFLLASCGHGDKENAAPAIQGSSTLISGVVPLDPATEALIAASDATSVTFTGAPAAIAGLQPGDVFIAEETARKVVSITTQGGNTVVQTSEPAFSEVFRSLQVSVENMALTGQHVVPLSTLKSAQSSAPKTAAAINVTTEVQGNNHIVHLTDPESTLQGDITFTQPNVTFKMNYGILGNDQYATIHFNTGATVDVTLKKEVSSEWSLDVPLLRFQLPIPVTGGTVRVGITLILHFAANGSAEIVMGIHQGTSLDAGMTATLNPLTVTPQNGTTHEFSVTPPQFNGELNAEVAIDPNVDVLLLQYSLAGIANNLALSANATATAGTDNACFRLQAFAGLSSEAYVLLPTLALEADFNWDEFFSEGVNIGMERYPAELFSIEHSIYDSGEQCLVPPIANAGQDQTVLPNAAVQLDGSQSSDPTGKPLAAYAWTQTGGPQVALTGADTATPSFTAPATPATLSFRLAVTNERGAVSAEDDSGVDAAKDNDVTVTVSPQPATPAAPTGVMATPGDTKVTLSWNSVTGATSYNAYLATETGVSPANFADSLIGATSPLLVSNLANGTPYYFVVTAVNAVGEGAPSAEVTATPRAPSQPGESSIDAGGYHVCVVLADGGVACWGGELGNGSATRTFTPARINGISSASMVATGWDFSCALLGDGTVRCWGNNGNGRLGNGSTQTSVTPVMVSGISNAKYIAAGYYNACAVIEDGSVRCWGWNLRGQLGNGQFFGASTTPVTVLGISTAKAITGGEDHMCALLENGRVRCWGNNNQGQLGSTTTSPSASAPTVEVTGITSATALGAGRFYSCAALEDGSVRCWGTNSLGQLGSSAVNQGSYTYANVGVDGLSSSSLVEGGYVHTCADSGGALKCWGSNSWGQLGNGTYGGNVALTPVSVVNLSGVSAVAAGNQFTCAVAGGTVQCWGFNDKGQLGKDPAISGNGVLTTPATVSGVAPR